MLNTGDIYRFISETGDDWATKHESAELLRETQKILKAKLMKESNEKSISGKELAALSDSRYEEHVLAAVKATGAEVRAKVEYAKANIKFEMWRTENANHRAAHKAAV